MANRFLFPLLMSVVVHVRPKKYFATLHVKAWRKNLYPPVASQFDVPPVVACVWRSFHGHRLAPEEEGYNDH